MCRVQNFISATAVILRKKKKHQVKEDNGEAVGEILAASLQGEA